MKKSENNIVKFLYWDRDMPRGRFISKEISFDKTVNELSCFESMLAFTWLIPHLDREGRIYGDPAVVRSTIFPRRSDITIEQMESFIQEWHDNALIIWYEVDGDKYIWFPNFEKHQVGLNKSREAESTIPAPSEQDMEQFMIRSGVSQDEITVKLSRSLSLSKVKLKVKEKDEVQEKRTTFPSLTDYFHELSGLKITEQWSSAEERLRKAGITPSVLEQAWMEIKDKQGYKIVGLQSMVNACMAVKNSKNYAPLKQKDYDRWLMPKEEK